MDPSQSQMICMMKSWIEARRSKARSKRPIERPQRNNVSKVHSHSEVEANHYSGPSRPEESCPNHEQPV
jgi:hypothetical protein